ncbi:MAG TPA: sulfotransferase [Nitrospirota bacterium]|nr:sulfotransferase [Nitrospirota bacterium]
MVIVTGLPRSGTSMMMKMLEAGGIAVITDRQRQADEDNPNGYFELEQVKEIKRNHSWLDSSTGEAVKMVSMLLYDLPQDRDYILIFMKRNLDEVIASQKVMLARKGESPRAEDDEMKQLYLKHLSEIETWLAERKNVKILYINYEEVVKQPLETSINIQNFLGRSLNIDNMINSVDPTLYRQRSAGITADIQEKESGLSELDNEKIREQLASLGYM